MEHTKQFRKVLTTNGKGYWNNKRKAVRTTALVLDDKSGELRVYFSTESWRNDKDGLIYTDPQWLKELQHDLSSIWFSQKAVSSVGYSEQGMQGSDYVSLDIGDQFVKEFVELSKKKKSSKRKK